MAKDPTDIEKRKEEERKKEEQKNRQQTGQPAPSGQTGPQGGNRLPQPGQPWNKPTAQSTTNPKPNPPTTPRHDIERDPAQEDTDKRRPA